MDTGNSLKSWQRMIEAAKFYETRGYTYYPVDWAVNTKYHKVTFDGVPTKITEDLALVGSAEQGFIKDLEIMPRGTFFFAISPCFRWQDHNKSEYHRAYFLKLELFFKGHCEAANKQAMEKMIEDAKEYFKSQEAMCEIISFENGSKDLECKGVELGSYGIRSLGEHSFTYGTGVAEPRLSQVLEKK